MLSFEQLATISGPKLLKLAVIAHDCYAAHHAAMLCLDRFDVLTRDVLLAPLSGGAQSPRRFVLRALLR